MIGVERWGMSELMKIAGEKGCGKCPAKLEYLAKELEQTARLLFIRRDQKWERIWERAVGIRMAMGLLKHGVTKEGQIMVELPPPPGEDPKSWAGGPRFHKSGFSESFREMPTNPKEKNRLKFVPEKGGKPDGKKK
jgi:hypothetical protein